MTKDGLVTGKELFEMLDSAENADEFIEIVKRKIDQDLNNTLADIARTPLEDL